MPGWYTDRILIVSRSRPSGDGGQVESRHNRIFKKAFGQIMAELGADTTPRASITPAARRRVLHAIGQLDRVLEMNPQNWSALWCQGKGYQACDDHSAALERFMRARSINPRQPDVAREASISAMECGEIALALDCSYAALSMRPSDPGLLSNLALALLFAGRADEANGVIDESLRIAPNDPATLTAQRFISEVLSGERACPLGPAELGVRRALS